MSDDADALAQKWRNKNWGDDRYAEFKADIAAHGRAAAERMREQAAKRIEATGWPNCHDAAAIVRALPFDPEPTT